MKLVYGVCFYPYENGTGYTVVMPDLPGCVMGGDDLASTIEMAVDAASGWVLDELESGRDVPPASDLRRIFPESRDGFVNAIVLDRDEYAEKYGNKAIRKNVTTYPQT